MQLLQGGERNQLSLDIHRRVAACANRCERSVSVCSADWNRFVEMCRGRKKQSQATNRRRESRGRSCAMNKNKVNCDLINAVFYKVRQFIILKWKSCLRPLKFNSFINKMLCHNLIFSQILVRSMFKIVINNFDAIGTISWYDISRAIHYWSTQTW